MWWHITSLCVGSRRCVWHRQQFNGTSDDLPGGAVADVYITVLCGFWVFLAVRSIGPEMRFRSSLVILGLAFNKRPAQQYVCIHARVINTAVMARRRCCSKEDEAKDE